MNFHNRQVGSICIGVTNEVMHSEWFWLLSLLFLASLWSCPRSGFSGDISWRTLRTVLSRRNLRRLYSFWRSSENSCWWHSWWGACTCCSCCGLLVLCMEWLPVSPSHLWKGIFSTGLLRVLKRTVSSRISSYRWEEVFLCILRLHNGNNQQRPSRLNYYLGPWLHSDFPATFPYRRGP